MNPASDNTNTSPQGNDPGRQGDFDAKSPGNWREALLALISSRIALICLESREAARDGARRLALLGALVCCMFFAWALLLAFGIGWLTRISGWPWYGIALVAAIFHLAAAAALAVAVRTQCRPAFPVTRAEFKKDREWIEILQQTKKSKS